MNLDPDMTGIKLTTRTGLVLLITTCRLETIAFNLTTRTVTHETDSIRGNRDVSTLVHKY